MSLVQVSEAPAPAVEAPAVAAVVAPAVAAPAVAAAPVRPEGLGDAFWDDSTGVKTPEMVARLTELETAAAARAEGVPADAAGYKLELPEPIMGPDGKTPVSFNAEDPLAKGALAWAHENGVSQAGLSKLLGVFASNEMASIKANNDRIASETAKLGANHEARFTAVNAALTKHAGAEGAKAIMGSISSAAAVVALEAVVKQLAGPSIGTPPPATKTSNLDGLQGAELLQAIRAQA